MHWISKKIALFFIRKGVIEEDEEEIYIYSFEILLSTILNALILLVAAIITRRYLETLAFAVVFITLRRCAGGYHAKTHWGCLLMLILAYTVMLVCITFIDVAILILISKIVGFFFITVLFALSPIDHPNNPIDKDRKKKMHLKTILFLIAIIITNILLEYVLPQFTIAFSISYAACCVSLSVIAGYIYNRILMRTTLKTVSDN